MAEISLGDVDVEAVLYRLTRHAQGLFGAVRCLGVEHVDIAVAGGDGPEDLAKNLLMKFLDPAGSNCSLLPEDRGVRQRMVRRVLLRARPRPPFSGLEEVEALPDDQGLPQ